MREKQRCEEGRRLTWPRKATLTKKHSKEDGVRDESPEGHSEEKDSEKWQITGRRHGLCCSVRQKGKGSEVQRHGKGLSNRYVN